MSDGHAVVDAFLDVKRWVLSGVSITTSTNSTMADAGFFKGTSTDQDRRFSDKETKLLKTMKFPASFDKKVR